jgi:hypothetical protein
MDAMQFAQFALSRDINSDPGRSICLAVRSPLQLTLHFDKGNYTKVWMTNCNETIGVIFPSELCAERE